MSVRHLGHFVTMFVATFALAGSQPASGQDESLRFLETRQQEQPFLLFLSYYNVHSPITPYEKRYDHFKEKTTASFQDATPFCQEHQGMSRTRQDNAKYASMVAVVDDSVGQILTALGTDDLAENTVVIFSSALSRLDIITARRGRRVRRFATGIGNSLSFITATKSSYTTCRTISERITT